MDFFDSFLLLYGTSKQDFSVASEAYSVVPEYKALLGRNVFLKFSHFSQSDTRNASVRIAN